MRSSVQRFLMKHVLQSIRVTLFTDKGKLSIRRS